MKSGGRSFNKRRAELLKAYNAIHWLTFTKWFYEDNPIEDNVWRDKRLWVHFAFAFICQSNIIIFKVFHLVSEENFFATLTSLTSGLVVLLVVVRTYVLYQIPTFKQLYFKPEIFNCNKHRPTSSLDVLIQTVKHSRKVGIWCMMLFLTFDVSWLVLPIVPPIIEIIKGTNQTYDELIPQYPSINPVRLTWLTKEAKYAFDLFMGAVNTIPWVGFVVVYYAVVQLFLAQHKIMMLSMTRGPQVPGDAKEPLELRLWIQDHALIRKLVYQLRSTVSPALAGTICANVFTVGLNMLALISSPIGPEAPLYTRYLFYFSFGTYSAISIFDIFIHCWLSSEISNSGKELNYAIYAGDWNSDLKRPPQDNVIPLMVCNKEIRFTALGLIPVTMTTFTEVIRISYSYFTILKETGH
uniref:Odorant receptor n=1 Tax=Adelphocoris lineolatus TaxID=236346 RepID=A0A2I4PH54_ADELI|nr:olfactory receptor 43 [Adelphocoris lineolatus]